MTVFQQPQASTPINAFQAPSQQSAFVPSATTSQMLAGDSGTPFDILANLGFGIQRQQAEQEVANQKASKEAAAGVLEAERFQVGQGDKRAAAKARVDAADLASKDASEIAKLANKNKVEAARVKREFDREQKELDREDKIAAAKAKKEGKGAGGKITESTGITAPTEDELKVADGIVEALDPAFEDGVFTDNSKKLARAAALEAKAIQAQAASEGNAISFPQAMRQFYSKGTSAPDSPAPVETPRQRLTRLRGGG